MRTKIFLSIIIAVAASSCFTLSSTQAISNDIPQKQGIIVSGETEGTVASIKDTFENVIESFGDNAVIYSPKKGYADVITETGEHRTFIQQKMYTLVSMKSGIEPPVEEINEKIGCSENYRIKFFRPPYSDVYSFYIPEDVDKNLVYDILKNDENVMTVEECLNVSEIYCTLENIFINSQLTDTELIEMYPEYQGDPGNIQFLTRSEHLEAHNGNWRNPTNWYFNPVTKEKFDFGDGPFIPCEVIHLPEPIIKPSITRTVAL